MTSSTLRGTTLPAPARSAGAAAVRRTQGLVAAGVLVAVVATDQASKWWAWRHITALVNNGSTWFLGGTVSDWFAADVRGALLDLAGAQVLTLALFALLRRRRPLAVLLPALLVIGGWGSNLLERLGLHLLTAPGTRRGAVDFIPLGGCWCNLADVCIAAGAVLLGLALCRRLRGGGPGRAPRVSPAAVPRPLPWRRAGRWALLAVLVPAALGAAVTSTAPGDRATAVEQVATPVADLPHGGGSAPAAPAPGHG